MRITLYPFVLLLLLLACSSDDDEPIDFGTMTLSISGVPSDMKIYQAEVVAKNLGGDDGSFALMYNLDVFAKDGVSKAQFNIQVFDKNNPDKKGVRLGDYGFGERSEYQDCSANGLFCEGAALYYWLNDEKVFYVDSESLEGSYARITKCDTSKKLVSGEYSVAMETDEGEKQLLIGSFTDVPYTLKD